MQLPDQRLQEESKPKSIWSYFYAQRLAAGVVVAFLCAAFFIMSRFSAAILIAPTPNLDANVLMLGSPRCGQCYPVVISRLKTGKVHRILFPAEERKRLEQIGVVPPIEELGKQKLLREGIAADAIDIIEGACQSEWDVVRSLDVWLNAHPDQRVRLLCDSFSSRRWRLIVERSLAAPNLARVEVEGIVDPRFNESNWWKSRTGLKGFLYNVFRQEYVRWHGEDRLPVIDWSADKYEPAALEPRR